MPAASINVNNGSISPSLIYNESEPFELYGSFGFDDTAVLQIVKPIDTIQYCLKPKVYLRFIHQNSSVNPVTVDYPIPEFNFCPGPNNQYYYQVHSIKAQRLMLISYINSTDIGGSASYYALLLDLTGNVIRYV